MPTDQEKELIEILQETRVMLEHCDEGRAGRVNAPEDAYVRELCERIGYGAVMDSAQRSWELKDAIGCFTCGPCLSTVRSLLKRIDKVLEECTDASSS